MDPDPLAELPLLLITTFTFAQGVALACALLALLISAFVSGSEISFFSLTPQEIDDVDSDDSPNITTVSRLLAKPERLLATILIINNLVNVTIVVLLNFALGPIFDGMPAWASFVLQSVLMTFLILLFGEILPKLYANHNPMGWALTAATPLNVLVKVCYPISSMLMTSTTVVNRFVTKKAQAPSTDELTQALEITDKVNTDDKEMLQGILTFGDRDAAEIMTPRIDLTDIDYAADFDQVMQTVVESGYSRLPVYEGNEDTIKGVLYSRDLLPYVSNHPADFKWQSLLRPAYFVPESRRIDDLLEDFRSRKIHLAIVVDEFGGTQGIVTLEDILEEIVGDIDDEYDEEEQTYKRLCDNSFIFEGRTPLNEFFHVTGLDPDDYADVAEDAETLAGMLLAIKGDFPKEKEPLQYGNCRFLVLDIQDHRIISVRVKVLASSPDHE